MTHRVTCGDPADDGDPEEEWVVAGFSTAEKACEYARRFIRAAVEDLRAEAPTPQELHDMYAAWGEYALTAGLDNAAWVAFCIANPATVAAETDYARLDPNP